MEATFLLTLLITFLASFIGYELISKIPQTLHTPLMSVTNAISSVIIVGAIIASLAGTNLSVFNQSSIFGFLAIVLAMINVIGGFAVTNRMLNMIAGKNKRKED